MSVRLSCAQCQRRKTKCNKQVPCSACLSIGARCEVVQRERLPRGKSGRIARKNVTLAERVSNLEKLLERQEAMAGNSSNPEPSPQPQSHFSTAERLQTSLLDRSIARDEGFSQYVAPDFWASLSEQVCDIVFYGKRR